MTRWIEVFTGAYASGKSETSINRAFYLNSIGENLTLVDLDTVEPAYTLRPIKKELQHLGLSVVALDKETAFGLGEAGSYITAEQKMCLHRKENLIIDVGYGVSGLDALVVLDNIELEPDLRIYMVINPHKFETSSPENILEHVRWSQTGQNKTWKITGFICNPHFSDQTTLKDIIDGYKKLEIASHELEIPIKAISIETSLIDQYKNTTQNDLEIWEIKRFMPKALW